MKAAVPLHPAALVEEGKRVLQVKEQLSPDNIKAFSLFSEAALGGNAEAQYLIWKCYLRGYGVPCDDERGMGWLRKSADQGFAKALLLLGCVHHYGRGVPPDEGQAIECYAKAAEGGSLDACACLSQIYKDRKDPTNQLRWNKEAALRGCFDSLWAVVKSYEFSEGVTIDLVEAHAWLSLYEDDFTRSTLSKELWAFQLFPEVSTFKTSTRTLGGLMSPTQLNEATERYRGYKDQRAKWLKLNAAQNSPIASSTR